MKVYMINAIKQQHKKSVHGRHLNNVAAESE